MDIYMDCRTGVSGGALLGALCHLGADRGLDVAALQEILCAAGVPCRLALREECRAAGPGCTVAVHGEESTGQKHSSHPADLRHILRNLPLSDKARHRAEAVLDALVVADAPSSSPTPSLSPSPSIDMFVEIVGVCWALDALGIDRVLASPLPWATGACPAPSTATARLMEGKPVFISTQVGGGTGADLGAGTAGSAEGGAGGGAGAGEVVTPLGAALVHVLAEDFSSGVQGRLQRVGVGYGGAGVSLRLLLLEAEGATAATETATLSEASGDGVRRERVTLLESHVDHLSGEELGVALQELSALPEVLDVLWLPGIGKKNRPAGSLRVLCLPRHAAVVERAFFAHTHSLGVRCQHMERAIAPRGACTVETAAGPLRAKRYRVDGADYVRVECDALRAAVEEQGLPPLALARGVLRRG